ncbi:hypothetical protein JKP88DRAFT_276434 [Tribonema minus]|uniref:Uncharacterized protein n=1 Tax=Tribonema minus TaxID=303371 RepID=A0A835Z4R0_9STRA|nr:hypothetical protein JKP88DRAFT_276434 [Tribonema minus]
MQRGPAEYPHIVAVYCGAGGIAEGLQQHMVITPAVHHKKCDLSIHATEHPGTTSAPELAESLQCAQHEAAPSAKPQAGKPAVLFMPVLLHRYNTATEYVALASDTSRVLMQRTLLPQDIDTHFLAGMTKNEDRDLRSIARTLCAGGLTLLTISDSDGGAAAVFTVAGIRIRMSSAGQPLADNEQSYSRFNQLRDITRLGDIAADLAALEEWLSCTTALG